MKRRLTVILSIAICLTALLTGLWLPAKADYKVHSIKGQVSVVRGGKAAPVTKDMVLEGKDQLDIKPGATVEILNTSDSRIYVCSAPGKKSVTGCIITARAKASDNFGSVNSRLNLSGGKSKKDVHTEAGRVTRDMRSIDSVCCDTVPEAVCDSYVSDCAPSVADSCVCDSAK